MMADASPQDATGTDVTGKLRQMIAVLEDERQALAALDADRLENATRRKEQLCAALEPVSSDALDPQTRSLVETARTLNDVNRRVRNLLSANVAARLDAMGGVRPSYDASLSTVTAIRA